MKAIFFKDVIANRHYLLILGVITLVLLGFAIYADENIIVLPVLFALVAMFYFSGVFARDAESQVNRTLLAGPITRNQLVNSHYLIALVLGLLAFVVTIFLGFFTTEMDWEFSALFALCSLGVTVVIIVIQLPLLYKLGPDKARLFTAAVFVLIFIVGSFIDKPVDRLYDGLQRLLDLPPVAGAGLIIVSLLALSALSLSASRRIMGKKEF